MFRFNKNTQSVTRAVETHVKWHLFCLKAVFHQLFSARLIHNGEMEWNMGDRDDDHPHMCKIFTNWLRNWKNYLCHPPEPHQTFCHDTLAQTLVLFFLPFSPFQPNESDLHFLHKNENYILLFLCHCYTVCALFLREGSELWSFCICCACSFLSVAAPVRDKHTHAHTHTCNRLLMTTAFLLIEVFSLSAVCFEVTN